MPLRIALLCGVTLAAAGCGGDAPDAVADYRERVGALCAGAVAEIEGALATGARPAEVQRITERTFERMVAVRPPPELAAAHADLRRAGRAMIALGKEGRADPAAAPRLRRRYAELGRRVDTALRRLGLERCPGG